MTVSEKDSSLCFDNLFPYVFAGLIANRTFVDKTPSEVDVINVVNHAVKITNIAVEHIKAE